MEAIARKRFIRQSPYKIRYVLRTVKGLTVDKAINKLSDLKSCILFITSLHKYIFLCHQN